MIVSHSNNMIHITRTYGAAGSRKDFKITRDGYGKYKYCYKCKRDRSGHSFYDHKTCYIFPEFGVWSNVKNVAKFVWDLNDL